VVEFSKGLDIPTPRIAATLACRKADGSSYFLPLELIMKTLHPDPPYEKPIPHPDNRFMALTGNCTDMPTLFVDTHVPLDVLYDAANYRIRAVTQVLENMSMRGSVECESFILSDFALLCAIPLRDGCDVLDVIGRRLRAMSSQ
jgi:hypothetical protein